MQIMLREPDDADELRRRIRQATHVKQRDRLRAVQLAIEGEPTPSIMRVLGRSRGFVQRWCHAYRDHGPDAVAPRSPSGRPPQLTPEQAAAFKQRVLAGPTVADGVCALRGREFVRILEQEIGAAYELSGAYDLLHRLGLSVLTPRPQYRKADPQAVAQWVQRAPFHGLTVIKLEDWFASLSCRARSVRSGQARPGGFAPKSQPRWGNLLSVSASGSRTRYPACAGQRETKPNTERPIILSAPKPRLTRG